MALTLVGLGSRVCGDDAVGLQLAAAFEGRPGVAVALWEDRDALDLAGALLELDGPVLIVDCAEMGLAPGAHRAFAAHEARLAVHAGGASTHGFGVADALALATALGFDRAVRLFGVQPFDLRPGRLALSAGLEAAQPRLLAALEVEVARLGAEHEAEAEAPPLVAATVTLRGLVQGVGMRPTLARLAAAAGLGGAVHNGAGGVTLRLEGPPGVIEAFLEALPGRLPAAARLDALERGPITALAATTPFAIARSSAGDRPEAVVPPDLASCPRCLAEVRDPGDRRFGYAFTTCTDCGPRYTVVQATPYDRERTTLAPFPLCADCAREYADPADRRFHAESTACPVCGPQLRAEGLDGAAIPGDPLRLARAALAAGGLVALRGVGGFQLAVDATSRAAVAALRALKRRPDKPLALMAADLGEVEACATVDPAARAALTGAAGPVVLLDPTPTGAARLPVDLLSPDAGTLGVMLPTTPLHALLFQPLPGDPTPALAWLVMTSANAPGAPIATTAEEVRAALDEAFAAIESKAVEADGPRGQEGRDPSDDRAAPPVLILTHDREIAWRADDSVVTPRGAGVQVWRRARGLAPTPLRLAHPLGRVVLALGADLKNTVALGADDTVIVSPHLGDLAHAPTRDACAALARALPALYGRRVDAIAVDLHPDLGASRVGADLARAWGVPLVAVQHHHAHAAACLAEHGLDAGLALVWDGVGLGHDGRLWGGELLHLTPTGGCARLASFRPAPLPGGDAATQQPERQWVARLATLGDPDAEAAATAALVRGGADPAALALWRTQATRGVNAPETTAVGRLFDAVAVALGLAPARVSWEGQAAVRLEAAARRWRGPFPTLPLPLVLPTGDTAGLIEIDWRPLVSALLAARAPAEALARAFHEALADAAVAQVAAAVARVGAAPVALSGGVFQNRLLAERVVARLTAAGQRVLEHAAVPPNDGGVALGQAVIAGRVA